MFFFFSADRQPGECEPRGGRPHAHPPVDTFQPRLHFDWTHRVVSCLDAGRHRHGDSHRSSNVDDTYAFQGDRGSVRADPGVRRQGESRY